MIADPRLRAKRIVAVEVARLTFLPKPLVKLKALEVIQSLVTSTATIRTARDSVGFVIIASPQLEQIIPGLKRLVPDIAANYLIPLATTPIPAKNAANRALQTPWRNWHDRS
jgi:hypothetical protein